MSLSSSSRSSFCSLKANSAANAKNPARTTTPTMEKVRRESRRSAYPCEVSSRAIDNISVMCCGVTFWTSGLPMDIAAPKNCSTTCFWDSGSFSKTSEPVGGSDWPSASSCGGSATDCSSDGEAVSECVGSSGTTTSICSPVPLANAHGVPATATTSGVRWNVEN